MKKVFEHKSRNFGNGRYVHNVFEKTITEQANRLSKKSNPSAKELNELTLDDVRRACASVKY